MSRTSGIMAGMALALALGFAGCGKKVDGVGRVMWLPEVYIALAPQSMQSLLAASAQKGPGKVKASDFKPVYWYTKARAGGRKGNAIAAYSDESLIPADTVFMKATIFQLFEGAIADKESVGVILQTLDGKVVLSAEDMKKGLDRLPNNNTLPLEILVKK